MMCIIQNYRSSKRTYQRYTSYSPSIAPLPLIVLRRNRDTSASHDDDTAAGQLILPTLGQSY